MLAAQPITLFEFGEGRLRLSDKLVHERLNMGWWSGHVAKSPHGVIFVAISRRHDSSKLKTGQNYLHRRSSPEEGLNSSSRRSKITASKNRSVSRRLEEPLEAELVVLFGTTSLIILVPWIVKDPRFLVLLPIAVFLVPGLLDTCKAAFVEIIHSVSKTRNGDNFLRNRRAYSKSKPCDNIKFIRRYPKSSRSLASTRQRIQLPDSDMERKKTVRITVSKKVSESRESKRGESNFVARDYIKLIPFFRYWGGFL